MKRVLIIYILLLFMANYAIGQNNMIVETSPEGNEYLLYLPVGYDPLQEYPLILYLHGAQAVSQNIANSFGKGLPGSVSRNNILRDYPFIMVAPHFKGPPQDNSVPWDNDKIIEVLNWVESQYSVDQDRILGSGVSLGAKGIIDFALAYPQKMAGIAPISGNAFVQDICDLDEVAVWAFHGDADGTIPISGVDQRPGEGNGRFGSQVIIDSLNACSPAPGLAAKLTIFKAKGHNGWDQVYDLSSGYNLFDWMEVIEKGVFTGYSPLVNLGIDRTFVASPSSISINSFSFDPDDDEANLTYNWQQLSGTPQTFQNGLPTLNVDISSADIMSFRLTVSDVDGNSNSDEVTINVLGTGSGPQISGLQFFYDGNFVDNITGDYAIDMSVYDNPDLINLAAVPQNMNARASVRFGLDENNNFVTQNENKIATFYLIGGPNGSLFKPSPEETYTITTTAFADRNAQGPGVSFQSNITFSSTPLPIELASFSAHRDNNDVVLRWSTASEINNSHFEIYQGIGYADKMNRIANVQGQGNSTTLHHYEYRINQANACSNLYYQLRNVDFDGTYDNSKIISVYRNDSDCDLQMYPNPNVSGQLTIAGPLLHHNVELELQSLDGQTVRTFSYKEVNNQEASVDLTGLKSGIYYLRVGTQYRKLFIK